MKYFKGAQFIPSKGEAWMYYETDDELNIQRQLTHVPSTQEVTKTEKPVVKKLFRPEALREASAEEFKNLWNENPPAAAT